MNPSFILPKSVILSLCVSLSFSLPLSLCILAWYSIICKFLFDHLFFIQVIFILLWIKNSIFLVLLVLDCSGAFNHTRLNLNQSNTGYVWTQTKKPNMSHRNIPSPWTKIPQSNKHQLPQLSSLSDHLPTSFMVLLADNSRSQFVSCYSSSILKLLWAELSLCKSHLPVLLWPLSSVRHCKLTDFSDTVCGKIPWGT